MHENPSQDGQPVHPDVSHEKSDANVSRILLVGLGMAVLAALMHVAVAWQFGFFRREDERRQPKLSPLVAENRPQFPRDIDNKIPPPRLEKDDRVALVQLRAAEDVELDGAPSWVDPKAGTVRIPIDQAMRLLADPKFAEGHGIRVQRPDKAKDTKAEQGGQQ